MAYWSVLGGSGRNGLSRSHLYVCMYVCVCVCVYIYIYIYIYTHTYITSRETLAEARADPSFCLLVCIWFLVWRFSMSQCVGHYSIQIARADPPSSRNNGTQRASRRVAETTSRPEQKQPWTDSPKLWIGQRSICEWEHLREMGGAPRNPAPRNQWLVRIVKPLGCHCTDGHLTSREFTED